MADYNLVQFVFDRSLLTPNEDVAVMTCHIRAVVAGAPDIIPVTSTVRTEFDSNIDAWWTSIKGLISNKIQFREARYYDVPPAAGGLMGPPVHVHPVGILGGSTGGALPPQVACSVTFKTDSRKHWGRMYVPGLTTASLTAEGRITSSIANSFSSGFHNLTDRSGTGGALTVFSRTQWTHHDPQTIQVDDTLDVIRRRRFGAPTVRSTVSAG